MSCALFWRYSGIFPLRQLVFVVFLFIICFLINVFPLQFEADRRAFFITVNSFGTALSSAERSTLYPSCGKLFPEGLRLLTKAEDHEQVKAVADCYPVSLLSYTCPDLQAAVAARANQDVWTSSTMVLFSSPIWSKSAIACCLISQLLLQNKP